MWRTEVSVGARTWSISTARVGQDPNTREDVFETIIIGPGEVTGKPAGRATGLERARHVHDLCLARYAAEGTGAVVVERLSRPWRF